MHRLYMQCWAACSAWLVGCGGHAVDLDRLPDISTTADAGATGLVVESLALEDVISTFRADDSRVYWLTNSGKLQSCDYEHCAQTKLSYVNNANGPLLTTETDLFFVAAPRYSTLVRCPKSGCVEQPTPFARDEQESWLHMPAADDQYLYWSSSFDIYRCPLSGCAELPELVASQQVATTTLWLEGSRIYYVAPLAKDTHLVRSSPKDGSSPPLTITTPESSHALAGVDIAVDEARLYWIDIDYHIQSCPITGCDAHQPVPLVTTSSTKSNLRVDATGLYWMDQVDSSEPNGISQSSVLFCPLTGCADSVGPRAVSTEGSQRYELTSKYVYWIDGGPSDGLSIKNIYRTLKPTALP